MMQKRATISLFLGLCICVMVHYYTIILQYGKSNKEDIMMTYIINGRGSVLSLTDSNLSVYMQLNLS